MINTKELRLENLFANIEDDSIYKVTKINEDTIEGICINNMGWFGEKHFHLIEQVLPIEITEEWLLKFGFQRHDEGSVSAQFSYGTNPVTQDYIIYLKWIKDYENDYQMNGFPFYQNGHFEIKTVHQLQNLYFALTGEELAQVSEGKNKNFV